MKRPPRNDHLSDNEIYEIEKLAQKARDTVGRTDEGPIAYDIFNILEDLDIRLLKHPIPARGERPGFSAVLLYRQDAGDSLFFLGLNTADHFDRQIFAIAHELYHFFTKSGPHLSYLKDEETDKNELKANRFAAEFLFPEGSLEDEVREEFDRNDLLRVPTHIIMRFSAKLHCRWGLPYRALIRRFHETSRISDKQYEELYAIDERDSDGYFYRIARAFDRHAFQRLNKVTKEKGTSPENIDIIIRNYENGLIRFEAFQKAMDLFGKKVGEILPEDEKKTPGHDKGGGGHRP